MNKQSKLESALEATVNILSGFILSWLVWLFLVPLFWPEHKSTISTSFWIVALFTITSWLRSYYWRRFFAANLHRKIHQLVKAYYENRNRALAGPAAPGYRTYQNED